MIASLIRNIFTAAVVLLAILFSSPKLARASEPLDSVLQLAELENLSDREGWRRLGHYRDTLISLDRSDVDGKEFFLAPNGKSDRHADLVATITAFFEPVDPAHEDAHAICRFPARYEWLNEKLALSRHLKKPDCPKLTQFLALTDVDSITYVYTSNFLKNPASMFGHTFMRFAASRQIGGSCARLDARVHGHHRHEEPAFVRVQRAHRPFSRRGSICKRSRSAVIITPTCSSVIFGSTTSR